MYLHQTFGTFLIEPFGFEGQGLQWILCICFAPYCPCLTRGREVRVCSSLGNVHSWASLGCYRTAEAITSPHSFLLLSPPLCDVILKQSTWIHSILTSLSLYRSLTAFWINCRRRIYPSASLSVFDCTSSCIGRRFLLSRYFLHLGITM